LIGTFAFLQIVNGIAHSSTVLDDLSPGEFEGFIALLLGSLGYDIEPDFRRLRPIDSVFRPDIIARVRDPLGTWSLGVVECKKTRRPIGRDLVEQAARVRNSLGADWAMLATTSTFSREAREYAATREPELRLLDRESLVHLALKVRQQTEDQATGFLFRLHHLPLHELGRIEVAKPEDIASAAGGLALPNDASRALVEVGRIPLRALELVMTDPRHLRALSSRQFEEFVAEILDRLEFRDVILTPRFGDGGKDVIASKSINGIPLT
jgi:HJR/Mrr/RecB family endonuclease